MENCNFIKISENEWRLIENAQYSFTLSEVAERANLHYATAYRIYSSLRTKADFKFVPDYKKMNLLNVALLFDISTEIKKIHSFTLNIRKVYGWKPYIMVSALVPYPYIVDYIETFSNEPIVKVIGKEFRVWKPDSGFSFYLKEHNIISPIFNVFGKDHNDLYKPVNTIGYSDKSPDYIDLAIILRKRNHPFEPILKGIRWIRKKDPKFPIISKQLLSYHYNHHVKNLWLYNSVLLLNDHNLVPFRIFYFEGEDSATVARILVNLPTFFEALIDNNNSLVIGQPPGYMFENIYKIISMYDVKMPLGDLILSIENMGRYIPPLWRFVKRNKWIWKEEMKEVIKYRV